MLRIGIYSESISLSSEVEGLVIKIGKQKLIPIDIDIFYSGENLCKAIHNGMRYDILYLGIESKKLNGIDAANIIRQDDSDVLIIYISCYEDHFCEMFETEPFGFLKDPINEMTFNDYFQRAYSKIEKADIYFEYKFNKSMTRIPMKNILYFESRGRMIYIIMKDGFEKYYGTLNELEKRLERKNSFLRIHQSFLVNSRHIDKIELTSIKLSNGTVLHISENRRKILPI